MKRYPASPIAFSLVLAFVTLSASITVNLYIALSAHACWSYAHGISDVHLWEMPPYCPEVVVLGIIPLSIAAFVFFAARGYVRPVVIFRARFFTGLAFLGYCLWLSSISYPITTGPLLLEWSVNIVKPAFMAPLTCLILIPMGLLLICFALLHDPQTLPRERSRPSRFSELR